MMTTTPGPAGADVPADGRRMRLARVVLVSLGVIGLGWAAVLLVDTVAPNRLPGVALWLGGAILLHDAVLSPLVFALGALTRRAGHRLAGSVIVTGQAAILLGSLVTLIVLPEIVARGLGPRNPTVLPLDYAQNLGVFWLVLIGVSIAVSGGLYVRARRANQRPSRRQS